MSLTVYIGNIDTNNKDYCMINDVHFNKNVRDGKIKFTDSIKKVIKLIDDVDYIGDYKFKSKFTGTPTLVNELSTGCKTAINVAAFPNKIFNIAECGDNAINVILKFTQGNIHVPHFIFTDAFQKEINIIINNSKHSKIYNNEQLDDILHQVFNYN